MRNYATFSVARLTNVDLNNLVYFVARGAAQVERGLDHENQAIKSSLRNSASSLIRLSKTVT